MSEQQPALNTDREIWRGKSRAEFGDPDRFYADSIFVTANGEGIGLNCGGYVIVKPLREWFALANHPVTDKPAAPQPSERMHHIWCKSLLGMDLHTTHVLIFLVQMLLVLAGALQIFRLVMLFRLRRRQRVEAEKGAGR